MILVWCLVFLFLWLIAKGNEASVDLVSLCWHGILKISGHSVKQRVSSFSLYLKLSNNFPSEGETDKRGRLFAECPLRLIQTPYLVDSQRSGVPLFNFDRWPPSITYNTKVSSKNIYILHSFKGQWKVESSQTLKIFLFSFQKLAKLYKNWIC